LPKLFGKSIFIEGVYCMKVNYVFFSVFVLALTLFSFNFTLNQQATNLLTKDHLIMEINYNNTSQRNELDFTSLLKSFSVKEGVNISQYNFLDEHTLNIYSTNLEKDPNVHLENGSWPKSDQFISNYNESNDKQIGRVSFPISMLKVRYYNFDQISNVGVGSTYYLSSIDPRIAKSASVAFSHFADVKFQKVSLHPIMFVDKTLLYLSVFSVLTLFVHIFFQIYKDRKQIYLSKLWGYSFIQSYFSMLNQMLRSYSIVISGLGILIVMAVFLFHQTYFWFSILITLISIVAFSLVVMSGIVLFSVIFIDRSFFGNVAMKGKPPFENFQLAAIIIKLSIVLMLLFIINLSLSSVMALKQNLDNKSYWKNTKNIYQIRIHLPKTNGDLGEEKVVNDKIYNFYQLLKLKKNGFVINAMQFLNNELRADKSPVFTYELNTKGEEQIYGSYGRRIDINENYLLYNPIETVNGRDILKQINPDSNVLNILVPEQFRKYESLIRSNYKEYFYFQKVEIPNIYNEAMHKPLNKSSGDELDINIIYTKSNQLFFTYNSKLGSLRDNNYIEDPIAIIINNGYDSSTITANATSSLFFEDNSQGEAYNSIIPLLKQSGTHGYVHSVASVYQEQGELIADLWQRFIQQLISILLMILLSVIFLIIFIWSYYKSNIHELNLKYLFGYSYWQRNKFLILTMLLIYIINGIITLLWFKNIEIIFVILVLIFIENCLMLLFTRFFNIKNTSMIIKGENL
jgi:putative ABC transport system permease protein